MVVASEVPFAVQSVTWILVPDIDNEIYGLNNLWPRGYFNHTLDGLEGVLAVVLRRMCVTVTGEDPSEMKPIKR